MNEVDITTSVLLESATEEYIEFAKNIAKKYAISIDLIEIVLEKALCRIREKKICLYASALIGANSKNNQKEEVDKDEQSV